MECRSWGRLWPARRSIDRIWARRLARKARIRAASCLSGSGFGRGADGRGPHAIRQIVTEPKEAGSGAKVGVGNTEERPNPSFEHPLSGPNAAGTPVSSTSYRDLPSDKTKDKDLRRVWSGTCFPWATMGAAPRTLDRLVQAKTLPPSLSKIGWEHQHAGTIGLAGPCPGGLRGEWTTRARNGMRQRLWTAGARVAHATRANARRVSGVKAPRAPAHNSHAVGHVSRHAPGGHLWR